MVKNQKTQAERQAIVDDIISKLQNYPYTDETGTPKTIDLYATEFEAIKKIKSIFADYVDKNIGASGKVYFEELNKHIEYILPCRAATAPLFVLRMCK